MAETVVPRGRSAPHTQKQTEADKLSGEWKARLSDAHLAEPPDTLVAILFLISTDNGFLPVYDKHLQDENISCVPCYNLPSDWKIASPGNYCFNFTLPECFHFKCHFVAVVLGELLLINAICSYPDVVNSVCLKISDHVGYENNTLIISKPKKLLYRFKDAILTPTRSAAFSYVGIPSASLTGLPRELLEYILILCGPMAACNLIATSRLLRLLVKNQLVWHTFYLQHFDTYLSNSVDDDAQDWYERYKKSYLAKVDVARAIRGKSARVNLLWE